MAAPNGYNKLTTAQKVTITPTYTEANYKDAHAAGATEDQLTAVKISLNGGEAKTSATVENASGSVLPSTGGIGTRIFTFGGIGLMLAAVLAYALKRRMNRSNPQ